LPLIIAAITFLSIANLYSQVTIGSDATPPNYSLLELDATATKGGMHLPQMTTQERTDFTTATSLGASAQGLLIWNTEAGKLQIWLGNGWGDFEAIVGNPCVIASQPRSFNWKERETLTSGEPLEGIGGQKATLDVSANNAQSYQWYEKPINPNAAPIDLGDANDARTPKYKPDLSAVGMRYYYCEVTGISGDKVKSEIAQVAVGCGALDYLGKWRSFMCYNIGADPDKTIDEQMSYNTTLDTDSTVYGHSFQWGRTADGHQRRDSKVIEYNDTIKIIINGSSRVDQVSASDTLYYGKFITGAQWNPKPDFFGWDPQSFANNPCPSGWRLPTNDEIASLYMGSASTLIQMSDATPNTLAWVTTATPGAVFKPDGETVTMFFPNASSRRHADGSFTANSNRCLILTSTSVGSFHQISDKSWISTDIPYSWNLPRVRSNTPGSGLPLRCIKI
jgi:hypothetical protein